MEKNVVKKIAKKVAEGMISSIPYEWPPSCILFSYQPMRPEHQNVHVENTDTSKARKEQ